MSGEGQGKVGDGDLPKGDEGRAGTHQVGSTDQVEGSHQGEDMEGQLEGGSRDAGVAAADGRRLGEWGQLLSCLESGVGVRKICFQKHVAGI